MKAEDIRLFGDLSKLREMLYACDKMLAITGDGLVLTTIHPDEVQAMANGLLKARVSISNALVSLGDIRGTTSPPPTQDGRDRFGWSKP